MEQTIREAIFLALDDDCGVRLETYDALFSLGEKLPDSGAPIFDLVEATDGRFYLPDDEYTEALRKQYRIPNSRG